MKVLKMTLKKKWFDMILSGEKTEEYREIKQYWKTRLVERVCTDEEKGIYNDMCREDFTHVEFKNGYQKDAPTMLMELVGIKVGQGVEKWGAEKGVNYFCIFLGRIVEKRNIKLL